MHFATDMFVTMRFATKLAGRAKHGRFSHQHIAPDFGTNKLHRASFSYINENPRLQFFIWNIVIVLIMAPLRGPNSPY